MCQPGKLLASPARAGADPWVGAFTYAAIASDEKHGHDALGEHGGESVRSDEKLIIAFRRDAAVHLASSLLLH